MRSMLNFVVWRPIHPQRRPWIGYVTKWTNLTKSCVVATRLHAKAGSQNSRYLYLFPALTPEQVAKTAYRRFSRGWSTSLPGFSNKLGAFIVRFVPDFLLVPVMGWFFRVRDDEGQIQGPGFIAPRRPEIKRAKELVWLETTE